MADPNLNDFYQRVGRLERIHAKGHGHDAAGTLGRAAFRREVKVNRRPIFRVGLFILAFVFGLKGAVHSHMGAEAYQARIDRLSLDGDYVQALLMTADPLTRYVSHLIGRAAYYWG